MISLLSPRLVFSHIHMLSFHELKLVWILLPVHRCAGIVVFGG